MLIGRTRKYFSIGRRTERGVAAIIFGLSLAALVGFAGIAVDLGRLFVTKAELQNAMDACALAGARYLGEPTPADLRVATKAAVFVGNGHTAVLQDKQVALTDADVTFSDQLDGTYKPASAITDLATAQQMGFVRCQFSQESIVNSFMQVLGFDVAKVAATAKASLAPSSASCFVPVAMCCENSIGGCGSAQQTSFLEGKWYEGRVTPGSSKDDADTSITGSFRWIRLPGESGGNDIRQRIEASGACEEIDTAEPVQSENGLMQGVIRAYNSRFGLYTPSYKDPLPIPDATAFPYTEMVSVMQTGGVNRAADATTPKAYDHYKSTAVPGNLPYGSGGNIINSGNAASGLDVPNNMTGLTSVQLSERNLGVSRRLTTLPIVKCGPGGLADANGQNGTPILGWACMLMLHPISTGNKGALPALENLMRLEYVDDASAANSACSTMGRPSGPGGTGPRVPALVQ